MYALRDRMKPPRHRQKIFLGRLIEQIASSFFAKPPLHLNVVRDTVRLTMDGKLIFECPLSTLGVESSQRLQFEIPAFLICLLLDILLSDTDGLRPGFDGELVARVVVQGLKDAAITARQPPQTGERLFARYALHVEAVRTSTAPKEMRASAVFAAHLVSSDSRFRGLAAPQAESRFAAVLKIGTTLHAFAEANIRSLARDFDITPFQFHGRA